MKIEVTFGEWFVRFRIHFPKVQRLETRNTWLRLDSGDVLVTVKRR